MPLVQTGLNQVKVARVRSTDRATSLTLSPPSLSLVSPSSQAKKIACTSAATPRPTPATSAAVPWGKMLPQASSTLPPKESLPRALSWPCPAPAHLGLGFRQAPTPSGARRGSAQSMGSVPSRCGVVRCSGSSSTTTVCPLHVQREHCLAAMELRPPSAGTNPLLSFLVPSLDAQEMLLE